MSKKIKDLFDGLQNAEEFAASKIQVVGKDTENGIVDAGVDTVIVDGSVNKIGIYGNDSDITVKGYAGKGTVKSVAGVELTGKDGAIEGNAVVLEDGINAKLVAGAKVEFTAEDKKYAPTSVNPKTVSIDNSKVVIYDAKVTDAFAGAVMTDTATSKKYKVEVQAVTKDASIDVIGGNVTNVYAGGAGATSITENATINISGGKITNVYAGGVDGAKVVGDVNINLDMNSAATATPMNVGTIYAGGKNANVLGDVTITVTTNGAIGNSGKIGKIVGTPSGKGVVFGSKNLVLDAYQGDFAATVKGMDTVTILDNSAVTFSKKQDVSMVNAEYIIELSEIDNGNQSAILTLKSDYKLNKLTVAINDDLITSGSFSRTLIEGVKNQFDSKKFNTSQVNILKQEGGLIADYQYELAVDGGKLIFTYTGATLELSVDGYVNRYGVANVLSSADDVVSFGWTYDAINKNYDREIAYNFKTMAGDDVVTIEDKTYFTGKLSLGEGNDTLTINGRLTNLDISGAGENLVVINGALDARNIVTSDKSVNTFVINGYMSATELTYYGNVKDKKKVVFLYEDGSTTENEVKNNKKIVSVTEKVYDNVSGNWFVTTKPWQAEFTVEQFLANADQVAAIDAAQDLVLLKGENTVVVNNGVGVNDITLGGSKAKVVLAANYTSNIDLRKSTESTLVIDDANAKPASFKGSRIGTSTVVIATDYTSTIGALDLTYKNAKLVLEQAVHLTVDAWNKAGFAIDKVQFGDNAMLTAGNKSYVYNYSGYWKATEDITALGTISDSVIEGLTFKLDINALENSVVSTTSGNATFNTVKDSEVSTATGNLIFNGLVDNTVVALVGNGIATFNSDANLAGFVYGNNTVTLNVNNANVVISEIVNNQYVAGNGFVTGRISLNLDEASLEVSELVNANATLTNNSELTVTEFAGALTATNSTVNVADFVGTLTATNSAIVAGVIDSTFITLANSNLSIENDSTVGTLSFDATSTVVGEGSLTVTTSLTLTSDFTFGADNHKIVIGENAQVFATAGTIKGDVVSITLNGTATITESNITNLTVTAGVIGDKVVAENTKIANATIADGAIVDLGVVDSDNFVNLTAQGAATIAADFEKGLVLTGGKVELVSNDDNGVVDVKGDVSLTNTELKADLRVWNYADVNNTTPNAIKVAGDVTLDGNFEADVVADNVAKVTLAEGTQIFRDNDDKYNANAYGHLNFNAATGKNTLIATNAVVEKGVSAKADLNFQGDVTADFDVTGKLSLGVAANQDDYVTTGDEKADAISATITGDVKAGSIDVDAEAKIVGGILEGTGAIVVKADASLTVTEDAKSASLTVNGSTDKLADGTNAKAGAVATFEKNVTTGAVVVAGNAIAETANKLEVKGDLAAGDVTVGAFATATVAGNVQAGAIGVTGTFDVEKDVTAASLTVNTDGKVDVEGNVSATAGANISGLTEIGGNLTVSQGNVSVLANKLDVDGKLTASGMVNVATAATLKAGAIEASSLTVNTEATAEVAGDVNVIQGVNVSGATTVTGNLTSTLGDVNVIANKLDVDGKITTGEMVNVATAATLEAGEIEAKSLTVNTEATATVTGNVNVIQGVNVSGTATAANVTATLGAVSVLAGSLTADGTVSAINVIVEKDATLNAIDIIATDDVDVNGTLEATGTATVTDKLTVRGNATIDGAVNAGTFSVMENATATIGALTVGNASIGGTATINGNVTAVNNFNVGGTATITGNVEATSMTVYENAVVDVVDIDVNALTIAGKFNKVGAIFANQLTINGDKEYTLNNITLGNNEGKTFTGADASLTINNANVKVVGDIAMVGTNSNIVTINEEQTITGKLSYVATGNNGLTIAKAVTVTNGIEFSKKLSISLSDTLTANITTKEYNDPAESADYVDYYDTGKIDGKLDLGAGNDTLNLNGDKFEATKGIDFGAGVATISGTAANKTVAGAVNAETLNITLTGATTIDGKVTAKELTIAGNVTVDDKDGITVDKVTLNGNTLKSQNTYTWDDDSNPETPEVPKTDLAAINTNEGADLAVVGNGTIVASEINANVVATDGDVNITANINGNISFAEKSEGFAGANNLTLTGKVTGSADLTNADSLSGVNEIVGGVKFDKLSVYNNADITANFSAAEPKLGETTTITYKNVDYYIWLGAYGPAALGAGFTTETTTSYTGVQLTLGYSVTINGNITATKAVDTITVGADDKISGVLDFGYALVNDVDPASFDVLKSNASNKLIVDKVKFATALDIQNVSIDRNSALNDVSSELQKAILEVLGENMNANEIATNGYEVVINGKKYGVEFSLIDNTLADDNPAKFDKSNIKVAITGIDAITVEGAGALKISSNAEIDGSVKFTENSDVLLLNGNLTLNALTAATQIATKYQYVVTDPKTGAGAWSAVASSEVIAEIAGVTNVLDFGTGTDGIIMADGTALVAAQVKFDTLNITGAEGYTGNATITAAELAGANALTINRDNLTVTGNVSAKSISVNEDYFKVYGNVTANVDVKAAGFMVDGAITGNLTLDTAFDASNLDYLAGNLTLNQVVKFTADDPETVADETAAETNGFTQGSIKFAEGEFTIANSVTVEGDANAEAAASANNSIVKVAGTQVDTANVTSLTISGAADVTGADVSVNNNGILNVTEVENLKALTLGGKVAITTATNVEALVVNGVNSIGTLTGATSIEVAKDAVLNGTTVNFSEITVSGEGQVNATITGTSGKDELKLDGTNVFIVDFAGSADDAVDTLTLTGDNTAATVYFSHNGMITGGGTLTGNVSIAGTGKLTIDSAIKGNVTGQNTVDLVLNNSVTGTLSGFKSYTGSGKVDEIKIDGAANVNIDVKTITGSANADNLTLAKSADVNLGAGNDALTLSATTAGVLDFGEGNDILYISADAKITKVENLETIFLNDLVNLTIGEGSVGTLDLSDINAAELVTSDGIVLDVAGKFTTITNSLGLIASGDNWVVTGLTVGSDSYDVSFTWDETETKYTVTIA